MPENVYVLTTNGELYHYGVPGMKWGIRRYQNKDGSLTTAGKQRVEKLTADLSDRRTKAAVNYAYATDRANYARSRRTTAGKRDRDYKTSKVTGVNAYTAAKEFDKQASKIEKKLSDLGVDTRDRTSLPKARADAGKDYVARSKGAKVATAAATATASLGIAYAALYMGAPVAFVYSTSGPKYKLREDDN